LDLTRFCDINALLLLNWQ